MGEPRIDVIFRKPANGRYADVFAIFPSIPHDIHGCYVTVYAHIGQHSGGSIPVMMSQSVPAQPQEYAPLKRELEDVVGYRLRVVTKVTKEHRRQLLRELQRIRSS